MTPCRPKRRRAAERVEKLNTVVDYSQGGIVEEDVPVDVPDEVHPEFMTIRVNYPIEEMTFGKQVSDPGLR